MVNSEVVSLRPLLGVHLNQDERLDLLQVLFVGQLLPLQVVGEERNLNLGHLFGGLGQDRRVTSLQPMQRLQDLLAELHLLLVQAPVLELGGDELELESQDEVVERSKTFLQLFNGLDYPRVVVDGGHDGLPFALHLQDLGLARRILTLVALPVG